VVGGKKKWIFQAVLHNGHATDLNSERCVLKYTCRALILRNFELWNLLNDSGKVKTLPRPEVSWVAKKVWIIRKKC